ncbi:hypothetical protein C0989_006089 [Termitomyces sp. Mn162]|nr:hypothetical protein C0989_006089 [Termitomyces sp. Mn162]
MSTRKRKHRNIRGTIHSDQNSDSQSTSYTVPEGDTSLPALYVQAYEADIVRGPAAKIAAASLEVPLPGTIETGGALIRWGAQTHSAFPQDEDILGTQVSGDQNLWLDRYDARLLLDTLPSPDLLGTPQNLPDSPGGWSDLPSDNEDVFFLDREEVEDFRRDKKRQHLEQRREERLKARREEDGESEEEAWGGSDEEPIDVQRDLMQRTASHLLSSPNPAQLEARILANHGNDIRFAFLRGRWSNTWKNIKGKAKIAKEEEQVRDSENTSGLGGLAGYGSDTDSDGVEVFASTQPVVLQTTVSPTSTSQVSDADSAEVAFEARRARAKEWVEKRRSLGNNFK